MDEKPKKRSLFHRAFWNQYNFILLGAAGLFSIATFTWIPLVLGAGVEALWLVLGADSSPFKRWVAIQEGVERRDELKQQAKTALAALEPAYKQRFSELLACSEREVFCDEYRRVIAQCIAYRDRVRGTISA